MIKVEQLRNFVSGNFTNAVLSGRIKDDKIDLNLKLDSKEYDKEYMHFYNVDLELIRKNPEKVLDYLVEKYLQNNTIIGIQYFVDIPYHQDKQGFVINGINSTFKIALTNDCMKILPKDFVKRLEFAKKKGIIKVLDDIEVKVFSLSHFDKERAFGKYSTGLRIDSFIDGLVHYDGLKILDKDGKPIIYKGELEFAKLLLSMVIEKGNIDFDDLERTREMFRYGYFNSMTSYKLNDNVSFYPKSNGDLAVFREFLNEYLSSHKDEVKNNQMKLVLNRKEW